MVNLIKCKNCKKSFPVNTWKHPDRKEVFCPFCRTGHTNRFFDKTWKPNEDWHKNKHKSRPFTIGDMRRILGGLVGGR